MQTIPKNGEFMTKNKKDILTLIQNSPKHFTAEEIYFEIKKLNPKISLSTVYRNLNLLEEEKLIKRYNVSDLKFVYDKSIIPHAHAVNDTTGEIVDLKIDNLDNKLAEYINGKITSYELIIHYKE